jgi:hypothetical protein
MNCIKDNMHSSYINTVKGTLYHSVVRHVMPTCYRKVFGDSSGLLKFNLAFTPRLVCGVS